MLGNEAARVAARAARLEALERWRQEELKERQAKLTASGGIPLTTNAKQSRRAEENLDDPSKPRFSADLMFLMAVKERDVQLAGRLLKRGININARNQYGLTPLHVAVTNDDKAMIEFLLKNGADIDAPDQDGWTPLHAAAHWGSNKAVQILCDEGANLISVNSDNEIPLDVAVFADTCALLKSIMEAEGVTAEMAEDAKRFEERMMLQDVVDEVVPDWGQAMHVACSKGYKSVAQALLRMKGADIESRDVYGWTPLHTAAFWDCHEVITLLVEMGADLNARTKDDESPYDLAVDRTTRALIRDLKKQNRRAGSRSISKGGKFGSTRYSAPHKQRGQIDMAKEDAAREAEKSRRASSKFLSAVDFTQEQLERLRMLPEHVWDEIEQLEAGVNGKSFKKYLWTILLAFVVIACLAAFLGLYFGLGQPCLPFQPCASVPYKPASDLQNPPVPLCVPGNAAGYNSSSNGQACLVAPPDGDLNNPYLCVQCVDWMTSQCSIPTVTLNIILLVLVALGAVCLVIGIPIAIWRANANKSPIAGLLGTEELAEIRGSNANTGMASLKRKASTQQLLATNEEGAAMVRRLSMLKAHAGSETTLRKGERPNADRKMGDVADRKLRSASELKLPDPAAGTGSDTSSVRNAAAGPDDETPAETAAAATEPAPAPTAADVAEVVASVLAEAPPESNGDAPPAAAAPSPPPAEAAAEPTAADEPASAPAPAADASAADAPAEPAEDGDRVPLIQEPSNAGGGAPGESWAINEGDDGVPLAPSVAPTLPTQFEDVKEQPADATSVVSNTTDVMND